jgi:hypothetical protein
MKTISITLSMLAMVLACASPKKETTETPVKVETVMQKQDLTNVINAYITLKDALVASDIDLAKAGTITLLSELKSSEINESIISSANQIAEAKDIKAQRAAFKTLTNQMIPVLKAASNDMTVYVQYCPMAFNNEGGNWLSLSEEIRNPYYGDMMLKCGRVTEKL